MILKDVFIRNIEATSYRENFLVSAVVSIFVIRIYLRFAHYPGLAQANSTLRICCGAGFL
jgi:hypothetical protein